MIDITNPLEGSLGASDAITISKVVNRVKGINPKISVSATIGDLTDFPKTTSLTAIGTLCCGVDIVKIGVGTIKDKQRLIETLKVISDTINYTKSTAEFMVVGYVDYKVSKSIDFRELPKIANKAAVSSLMLDTYNKSGHSNEKTLLDLITEKELAKYVQAVKKEGITCALAGSLTCEDIKKLIPLKPDIVAVRKEACSKGRMSELQMHKVAKIKRIMKETI